MERDVAISPSGVWEGPFGLSGISLVALFKLLESKIDIIFFLWRKTV